jgi:hypothetical protein
MVYCAGQLGVQLTTGMPAKELILGDWEIYPKFSQLST